MNSGKLLIVFGAIAVGIGTLLVWGPKIPWLRKLPGDIRIERENVSSYFPLTTSLIVSAILTTFIRLLRRGSWSKAILGEPSPLPSPC